MESSGSSTRERLIMQVVQYGGYSIIEMLPFLVHHVIKLALPSRSDSRKVGETFVKHASPGLEKYGM
jgi:hypothetical protein